jgi:dTDP-4-amino-4,6-dideoxygalactose transaminase
MKITEFALLGAKPEFDTPMPVGQLYFPSWDRYESAFKGIFDRRYYTNQGPLTQELEKQLQQFLGVRNAICVTNATIGLMIVAEALKLTGKVILPSYTFIASAQALLWTALKPVFCDIDLDTHQIALDKIETQIDKDVCGIMGVNLWGGACNPKALAEIAATNDVQLYFDSAHAFGCAVDDVPIGNFGRAEVFSFHATKILSAAEGGCICTNDDYLADSMRNIRSGYGADKPVNVAKTANGRMSEAQAAIALMSLEDFAANQKNNETLYRIYEKRLASIPGLHLVKPGGVSFSNYQYIVYTVDELEYGMSRDMLVKLLKAENVFVRRYFYPGLHRTVPFIQDYPEFLNNLPNTDKVCETCIQLPIGALVSSEIVERICDIVVGANHLASEIRSRHE